MTEADWPSVREIYAEGIAEGGATFNTECPTFGEWDQSHSPDCRLVAETDGTVTGFAVLSPVSSRPCYRGVAEVSLYVGAAYRLRGIGRRLLRELMARAEAAGYWSLRSVIFSENRGSIRLHESCGFCTVGTFRDVARDRFGVWQSTVVMEWRNDIR